VQVASLLKDYVIIIQELEWELLQNYNLRLSSVPSSRHVSSYSSDIYGNNISGLDFESACTR
jgi:hypothetical protein